MMVFLISERRTIRPYFIVQLSLSLGTRIICISRVPINDMAPMKNCLGGCKVGQIIY